MKTSKLFTLATGLVLLSSTVFAAKATIGKDHGDTTATFDSSEKVEWENSNDLLQEVLDMEAIPTIMFPLETEFTPLENSNFENVDPLQEVNEMEEIPEIQLNLVNASYKNHSTQYNNILDVMVEEHAHPLQDVMSMEAIPTINQPKNEEFIMAQNL